MKVSDAMTFGTATVRSDAPLTTAIRIMIDHAVSALPVIDDDGHVQGIISESDFFRSGHRAINFPALLSLTLKERLNSLMTGSVLDIMTSDSVTIDGDWPVQDAVAMMIDCNLRHVPVVDCGRSIGVISRVDVLRLLVDGPDKYSVK
jgi:CBS domain-containing protein